MTATKKPYRPAKTPAKAKKAGTETCSHLSRRRWAFSNLGTYVIRDVRNQPGVMSQHAAALALDLGYGAKDRGKALEACAWLTKYADELGIALVNDYMHGTYGRTWLCSRAAWRVHTQNTIGIRYHGIHVELHSWAANLTAAQYEARWRALPRP